MIIYVVVFILICGGICFLYNRSRPDDRPIKDFGYFKARVRNDKYWTQTKEVSDLNDGEITVFKNDKYEEFETEIVLDQRMDLGATISTYTKAEKVKGNYTLEIICIPFSNEEECKRKEKTVKGYFKNQSRVKYHQVIVQYKRIKNVYVVMLGANKVYSVALGEFRTVSDKHHWIKFPVYMFPSIMKNE